MAFSMSAASSLPYLLTVAEVAELLRTTPKAVYTRVERGLLPGVVRDGRRLLFLRDTLLASIAGKPSTSRGDSR